MDYDGNDFQSQNLRLAGEGSDKVSPVLRPYALPKYDFDESLHGHIRFDSSVDAEVFLGIESNEDNQWIEDFSHSSSGIVFSSTAVETCTILRQNNVWSEAASSESVEMLLKSVGQEEIVPDQTLTKAADACDELSCIVKKMEPDLKHEESSPSQIVDVTLLQPMLQPDEISEKDDVGGQQLSDEVASQNKGSNSSDGRGMDDGNVMTIGAGIPIADGCESADGKYDVPHSENDNMEVDGSCNNRRGETSTSNMHNNEDFPIHKDDGVDENVNHLVEKNNVGGTECNVHQEVDNEAKCLGENSGYRVTSNRENNSTSDAGLTGDDNLVKICTANPTEHSTIAEGDSETGFCSSTSEHTGNIENVVISQQHQIDGLSEPHVYDASELPLEAEAILEVHEGGVSKTEIDGFAKNESKMELIVNASDSITEIEKKDLLETDCKFDLGGNQEVDPSISGGSTGNVSQVHCAVGGEKESGTVISPQVSPLSHLGPEAFNPGENEEISVKESPLSNLKTSPELPHPPLEFAECKTDDSKKLLSLETVEKSLSVADGSNLGSENEQQVPILGGVTLEQTKEISESLHDSSVREHDVGQRKATSKRDDEVRVVEDVEPNQKNEETSLNQMPLLLKPRHPCNGLNGEEINDTFVSEDKNDSQISMPSVDRSGDLGHNGSTTPVLCMGSQPKLGATEDGKTSFNRDNATYGSPAVIRTSECSQTETKSEEAKICTACMIQPPEVVDGQSNRSLVSQNGNGNDASETERSFTFEVPPLPDTSQTDGKKWKSFSTTQPDKKTVEIPPTSIVNQAEVKSGHDAIHRTPQASGRQGVRCTKNSERKPRRASGKSTTKETPKKGRPVKEASSARHSERGDTTSHLPLNSAGILQPSEMQQYGQGECNNMKAFGVLSTSMSTLPDLNTQVSPSAAFQQPFTDLQQVELRAQIFVYGALIQGAAPDEAYMISAFGGSDGGKSNWESAWRKCLERVHGQKSLLSTPEAHSHSRLGNKAPDLSIKQSGHQSKVTSLSASRTTSKLTPTTVANPVIPLSSPLWTMSTSPGDALQHAGVPRGAVMDFQHALSPLHSHQMTPVRNFVGHNASWASQSPYRGPWQASNVETSARFSVLPFTETVNLTPARESSGLTSAVVPYSSTVNVPVGHVGSNANAAKVLTGSTLIDMSKVSSIADKHQAESKPRKRKKSPVTEEAVQQQSHSQSLSEPSHSQSQSEPFSAPVVTTNVPAPLAIGISSVSPKDHLKQGEQGDLRVTLSVETVDKLKEAQKQAEDAAELAAAAISHGEEIWNQLEKQKNSRLPLDIQTKLSSATIAISAAAAVAKAAAAAANVASNAALQAKLMADEAFVSSAYGKSGQANVLDVRTLGQATPASILQGRETTDASQSIITVAKEAARRRVEVASAAVKQAENINAIVRAAEIAAEAVSQAGKIVAMGASLPLSELVGTDSGAHWRTSLAASDPVMQSKGTNTERRNRGGVAESSEAFARHSEGLLDKTDHGVTAATEVDKKNKKGCRDSDRATPPGMVAESRSKMEPSPTISQTKFEKKVEVLNEHNIKEGSRVEVLRGEAKVAWFTADVLSLMDGKAYVCYHELLSEEGNKLEEWVALEGDGDGAPRIRFARPISAMPFEGTRKRRRAAMGDNKWSVGDRVDAWMQDSWQEGVVDDKSQNDESSFTIHFPASGESSVVKAWNLRSSLIWKNGSWVEFSNMAHDVQSSHKGDTPQEKRFKVMDTAIGTKENIKVSRSNVILETERPDDIRLLDLAINEKVFNIGRSSRDDIKADSLRMTRTGLQKEGSKVIFGVPKPGKKRKFMEVSKHYVADKSSRGYEPEHSFKSANYLMPQRPGPRGVKSDSNRESKDKGTTISKPKVIKSGKPPTVSGRTVRRKDNKSDTIISEAEESKMRSSDSNSENEVIESRSFQSSDGASEDRILFPSVAVSSDAPSRKPSTSKAKSEHLQKRKTGSGAGKFSKFEEEKISSDSSLKAFNEVTEPRRSNRKIQPTSRLLEGLQSSLIISKIPSVSHDKSQKSQRNKRD